jgi:hypothetical protein
MRVAALDFGQCGTHDPPRMALLISVVVPVYAERGNIGPFLERCVPILEAITREFEVSEMVLTGFT